MKLPYGISSFSILRENDYYYADRTQYLEKLEALGERYLLFLRPRRFGKSLFISTLEHYYGVQHKDKFDGLFGGTYIGKQPTSEANAYKILRFDFSGIETSTEEKTHAGFLSKVVRGVKAFISKYAILSKSENDLVLSQKSPAMVMNYFFSLFENESIYLLIDEYDHFANELLAFRFEEFSRYVSQDGFVRKFYEVLKTATGEGIIQRMFITGVTPITLDSLTSGFNITKNLSIDERFNEMFGFTKQESFELIKTLCEKNNHSVEMTMGDLKRWYNGYRFHPRCEELIYNPDMVLHFASAFADLGRYPDQMIDNNIANDYQKLQGLFEIKSPEQNYTVLEKLIEEGNIQSLMTSQFNFEKKFERADFVSLLFYLGYISIAGQSLNKIIFKIPNYVIQRLYWDYFMALVEERAQLDFGTERLDEAMVELAQKNQIQSFLELIEETLQALSNRDSMNFDEKYIKALFVGFANLTNLYFIKSEPEVQKKYPDILFLFNEAFRLNHQFIFELKYLKKGKADELETTVEEATSQLQGYLQSPEIQALEDLKAWVVVFVGDKVGRFKEFK